MIDLTNLNNEQKQAVLQTEGPLLILAGAGAGKTRVLTTKIAYLIEEKGVNPYNILAITFTNKAANEMKERVVTLVGSKAKDAVISTFHSFGLKILRENYPHLGYEKNFVIMDSDDSLSIIKRILKEKDLDSKIYNPTMIKNKISSCKNELITPEKYANFITDDISRVVSEVYFSYEKKLKDNNSVDFDDLLILPIKLFRENSDILERYQNRFKYILIDEYQDTNEAQYLLTKMISLKHRNICVVGDESQSIYSFRGANYRNILNFEKDYKATSSIKLEQNYRSTTNILDAANCVIKNNKNRKEKNLWSDRGTGEKIKYYRSYDEKDEAHYVAYTIKKLLSSDVKPEEIAVLYRTNAQSRVMEEEMLKENINYRVVGSLHFYGRREIKDLLAYLRLVYNEKDNVSLTRVINVPKRGIGLTSIAKLNAKADEIGTSMYEAIDSGKELIFKSIIEELKQDAQSLTLSELVEVVLDKSGLRRELEAEKTLEADIRLENLEEFKSVAKSFEEKAGFISLEEFLYEVTLVSDKDEYSSPGGKVSLMTVHAVKGLEFEYVFVIGLEEGIFPHLNALMEINELEEERRLAYVAITRAKDNLFLVNARRRVLYGKDQVNPPSRFLSEIDSELLDANVEITHEERINKEDLFYDEDVSWEVGDYAYHNSFGNGKVVEVTNTLVSIAFKTPHGIKKFMKNHKSSVKV